MFLDYRKPSKQLVVDLINRDNLNLPFPIGYDNCTFGTPLAVNNPTLYGFRNTLVTVYPNTPDTYRGPVRIAYRRLEPKDLFPNGRVMLDMYIPSGNMNKDIYVPYINEKYGTMIAMDEITSGAISQSAHSSSIGVSPACLSLVGNIAFTRVTAKIPISRVVPDPLPEFVNIQNSSVDNYWNVLRSVDFTPYVHLLGSLGNSFETPQGRFMLDVMSIVDGIRFTNDTVNKPYNLHYNFVRRVVYTLPNVNVPQARAGFNRVIRMYPTNASSWLKGDVLLHYNV